MGQMKTLGILSKWGAPLTYLFWWLSELKTRLFFGLLWRIEDVSTRLQNLPLMLQNFFNQI